MTNRKLAMFFVLAVVLGGAAYFLQSGNRPAAAKLNGKTILPGLSVADVAKVEIGGKLTLAASADGWKVESLYGFPADREKIAENLMKLAELKVGQVAHGRKLGAESAVVLKDASGKELAALKLGDKHSKKATGQAAMYGGGGYPDGRYVAFSGETVLVKDTLDAFDGDIKSWCNTRIASFSSSDVKAVSYRHGNELVELEKGTNSTWVLKGLTAKEELDTSKTYSLDSALSYLDFNKVADPKLTEAELGFKTGYVYTVTMKDGSNTVQHVATVGNKAKDSSDRYFKLDDGKWVYLISTYSAENMMKSRKDLVKAKEEPKKDEKKADAKAEEEKPAAAEAKAEKPAENKPQQKNNSPENKPQQGNKPQQNGKAQQNGKPQQAGQPFKKKEKEHKDDVVLQARTKGERKTVNTRSEEVELDKYNEKYENMIPLLN